LLWHAYKIGRFDPDDRLRVAADLLVELAFGETSAAYRKLVLRDQSVEFLAAYTNTNRDPSLLDIYGRIKSEDKIDGVEAVIAATNERFRERLVEPAELAALKSRLRYAFLMGLETPDEVAQALARPLALSAGLDQLEALYAMYERVTAEDIRDAAQAILVPAQRTAGVLRGSDG
jgi:zinc protease